MNSDPGTALASPKRTEFSGVPDDDLVEAVASGQVAAFAELYTRYRDVAYAQAAVLLGPDAEPEDLVQETFTQLLARLREAVGRHLDFSHELVVCMGASVPDCLADVTCRGVGANLLETSTAAEPELASLARQHALALAATAFNRLTPAWRSLVQRLEVEGQSVRFLAWYLDMDPVTVAVAAARGIEWLRIAYLDAILPDSIPPECQAAASRIARWIWGKLPQRTREQVSRHVADCSFCGEVLAELDEVRWRMRRKVPAWPLPINGGPTPAGRDAEHDGGDRTLAH